MDAPTYSLRMERDADVLIDTKVDLTESQDRVYAPELDSQSVMQPEVPPWSETYDISADSEDKQLDDEVREDKHRRIRHELEPGDIIEAVNSVARISGVDSYRTMIHRSCFNFTSHVSICF